MDGGGGGVKQEGFDLWGGEIVTAFKWGEVRGEGEEAGFIKYHFYSSKRSSKKFLLRVHEKCTF